MKLYFAQVSGFHWHPHFPLLPLTLKVKASEVAQLCLTLCDPMDFSLPDSSTHGIFQGRILELVAISFSRRSSWPRDRTQVSRIAGRRFTVWATSFPIKQRIYPLLLLPSLSCVRLFCDPMDCSPPGSSVHGISQARILEWVAISFSRESSRPRDRTWVCCIMGGFFTTEPPGKFLDTHYLYVDWKLQEIIFRGAKFILEMYHIPNFKIVGCSWSLTS